MKLPPFSEFLDSIDLDKMDYDLKRYESSELKEGVPFTPKQATALAQVNIAISKALLAQYHSWLSEQLP